MREEVQSPILMYTEKNELKTVFMMLKDKMLFAYILSSKHIRKKLIEKSREKQKNKNKDIKTETTKDNTSTDKK